jgi:hypothetical protein
MLADPEQFLRLARRHARRILLGEARWTPSHAISNRPLNPEGMGVAVAIPGPGKRRTSEAERRGARDEYELFHKTSEANSNVLNAH